MRSVPLIFRLTAFVLLMPMVAKAADAAKEPAPKADAADAKPAAADPGEEAMRAARAFFRAFAKGDDKAAYALTAPAYREANPAEKFAESMKAIRQSANVSDMQPMTGWVLLKPQEGAPRRAMVATNAMRMSRRRPEAIMRDGKPANPSAVGIDLIEKDGRWLVADARELRMGQDGGEFRFAPGREANDFAAPIKAAAEKVQRRGARDPAILRPITSAVKGTLTVVKPGSVTLKLDPSTTNPEAGTPERTFKVDDKTAVSVGTKAAGPARNGKASMTISYKFASAAELKAGQEATIEPGDEDDYAADVTTMQGSEPGGPGL